MRPAGEFLLRSSFLHSLIPPAIHSFIPAFIHFPFGHSFIHSCCYSPFWSPTHSPIPCLVTHSSSLQPFIHPHSVIHSFIPPFIHSSAVSQCLFCAGPCTRCWASLINKVDPVPALKPGYSWPRGWVVRVVFFLSPFSNYFLK